MLADGTTLETGATVEDVAIQRSELLLSHNSEQALQQEPKIDSQTDSNIPELIPNDPEKARFYAYHAVELDQAKKLAFDVDGTETDPKYTTYVDVAKSIAEHGLQPANAKSKEPGSVWYSGWGVRQVYGHQVRSKDGESFLVGKGLLYRFPIGLIPNLTTDYDRENGFEEAVSSVYKVIPPEELDYSLDGGETWRHASKDYNDPAVQDIDNLPNLSREELIILETQEFIRRRAYDREFIMENLNPEDPEYATKKLELEVLVKQAREELEHPTWSIGERSENPLDYVYTMEYRAEDIHDNYTASSGYSNMETAIGYGGILVRVPAGAVGARTPYSEDVVFDPDQYGRVYRQYIDYSTDGGKTWIAATSLPVK